MRIFSWFRNDKHPWDRIDPATDCKMRFNSGKTPRSRDELEELMRTWTVGGDVMKEFHYVSEEDRERVFQEALDDLHQIETAGDYVRRYEEDA